MIDLLDRPRATKPAAGVTLFTRDGSNTGNAIIVKKTVEDFR